MNDQISINTLKCNKCHLCVTVCPNKVLQALEGGYPGIRKETEEQCFICGHCMAVCPEEAVQVPGLSYERDFFPLENQKSASIDEPFMSLIRSRRAVRNFKDGGVPAELLEQVVEAISFAPPGFPPLKTRLLVVTNRSLLREAVPLMIRFYEKLQKMMKNPVIRSFIRWEVGPARLRTMQGHLLPMLDKRLPMMKNGGEDTLLRGAPALILFLGDRDGEDISQDSTLAAAYGMLAIHALGLGGSIMDIIPPALDKDPELRKLFSIPDDARVLNALIIGYPRFHYKKGIRRKLKEVRYI